MATDKTAVPTGPYVYALVDEDGLIFYIGKGRGRRMYAHVKHATRGGFGEKCARIRAILADGRGVEHRVLSEHASDEEALAAENALLESMPGLLNIAGPRKPHSVRSVLRKQYQQAVELGRRFVPFVEWLNVRTRSSLEISLYFRFRDDLWDTERLLARQMGQDNA